VQRALHWTTAILVGVLVATGAVLYVPSLATDLGGRRVVQPVHAIVGLCLVIPFVLALTGSWGRQLRADVRRINRFSRDDKYWLRSLGGDSSARLGKFNPGQKVNAVLTMSALTVLLLTGVILHWPLWFPLRWRTGATFVHDCFALGLVVLVSAHIIMAITHPQALRSMITGSVSKHWASHHAPLWLAEPGVAGIAASAEGAGGGGDPAKAPPSARHPPPRREEPPGGAAGHART
jgi:formate dehydrogenase subunit gamma